MSTRRFCSVLLALLAAVACSPGEGEVEAERFKEGSRMYAIQQKGALRVAVPDFPPFGSRQGDEGFSVALGVILADDLGVEPEIVTVPSEDMGFLAAAEAVDVGFPLLPVTGSALRYRGPREGYAFGSPYFVAHQRLLVPDGSGVEQIEDLEGQRICSYINQRTQVDVSGLVDATVIQAETPNECRRLLAAGGVDAATASDALLATLEIALGIDEYKIVGDQLNTEGYAAVTLPGPMATYVIGMLNDIEEDGTWLELYQEWLEPHLGPVDGPPELTLQDAASLYPPAPADD